MDYTYAASLMMEGKMIKRPANPSRTARVEPEMAVYPGAQARTQVSGSAVLLDEREA